MQNTLTFNVCYKEIGINLIDAHVSALRPMDLCKARPFPPGRSSSHRLLMPRLKLIQID